MDYDSIRELSYELKDEVDQVYKIFTPGKSFQWEELDSLMEGAIDTHIHGAPDSHAVRPLDELQIALEACKNKMGGVVFKCHSFPSARTTVIAQRVVNEWAKANNMESTKVIGGVVLNYNVGGLNPHAVEAAAANGGRYIWTPNMDSAHHKKLTGKTGGIEVIDKNNKIVPELAEVFKLIAKYDLVLSLTHHSTKERFVMIDAARELGVNRIEIVHPNAPSAKMSIDQMKMAAEKGVYLGLYCVNFAPPLFYIDEVVETIKEVGADHIVLGTDVGNWRVAPPTITYKIYMGMLLEKGISKADIIKMAKENPRKLIF